MYKQLATNTVFNACPVLTENNATTNCVLSQENLSSKFASKYPVQ